jgi:beta-glucosidase
VGGLNKNRQQDCEDSDRESYHLSFGQDELIAALARTGRPVVVANFGGNAYAMPWIEQVAGVLHCWYLGSEAGHALTDVLTGRVNPSGRLPMTFAKRVEDYPPMQYGREAYPGVDKQVYYREGIFVGYRHFVSRKVKALFPFGYGLSYTTFRYGRPRLDRTQLTAGGSIRLTVDVTNTGARRGEEVVQLYIGEDKPVVERPARELKDFSKVGLDPGETRTLTFEIRPEMLQNYSSDLHRWTSTPGSFHAYVSASSEDVRGAVAFELK